MSETKTNFLPISNIDLKCLDCNKKFCVERFVSGAALVLVVAKCPVCKKFDYRFFPLRKTPPY